MEGTVDGKPALGLIRRDGSVAGDRTLLERVDVVVAMGDSFADGRLFARSEGDPLVSTLTTTRAFDRVVTVDLYGLQDSRKAKVAVAADRGPSQT
ncbi:MAG: hypothetical protein ACRDWE_06140 [Acidimicrobiales bacterium]